MENGKKEEKMWESYEDLKTKDCFLKRLRLN